MAATHHKPVMSQIVKVSPLFFGWTCGVGL